MCGIIDACVATRVFVDSDPDYSVIRNKMLQKKLIDFCQIIRKLFISLPL